MQVLFTHIYTCVSVCIYMYRKKQQPNTQHNISIAFFLFFLLFLFVCEGCVCGWCVCVYVCGVNLGGRG